jgi:hypothetical protein
MINIDPLPRLPVSWKEFSDLLRASIPKTNDINNTNRIGSVSEVTNRLPEEKKLSDRASPQPQAKEKRLEEEEKDPIRAAIYQLRNGMPRSPPPSGKVDEGIDVLA